MDRTDRRAVKGREVPEGGVNQVQVCNGSDVVP